jgi:alkaline phosphatase
VVTNTRVTHATPAAAYARAAERGWESDADFVDSWGNDWWQLAGQEHGCRDIAHQFVSEEPGKNMNVSGGLLVLVELEHECE